MLKYRMMRSLQYSPLISIKTMKEIKDRDISIPFLDDRKIVFCSMGREALWALLKILGIEDNHNVLVPTYLCPIVAATILKFGGKVKLFTVNRSFRPDLDDIQRKIDENTKAILIVDYFGFPQPYQELKRICYEKGLYLIEDCSMALYSKDGDMPLGTFGDVALFSFRKTLPTDDGAAILVNNPSLNLGNIEVIKNPIKDKSLRDSIKLLLLKMENRSGISLRGVTLLLKRIFSLFPWHSAYWAQVDTVESIWMLHPETFFTNGKNLIPREMRLLSRLLISNSNHKMIARRRIANYLRLHNKLAYGKAINFVFPCLLEGVCPLFFPIFIQNKEWVRSKLTKAGIPIGDLWPEVPDMLYDIKNRFSESLFFEYGENTKESQYINRHILLLPVHQDLNSTDMDFIAEKLIELCG